MTQKTRRSVLGAVGGSLALGGCLSDAPGGDGTEPTTGKPADAEPTTTETATATDTTTGDWIERASKSPDPDHAISLRNEASESRTLRVAVVRRATGETVFETTERVSPGGEFTVYDLRRANPDGVETFEVCAELVGKDGTETAGVVGNATATVGDSDGESVADAGSDATTADSSRRDCATIDTSECYGDAHATVGEDGSLRIIYAIC
ncbi:hypothetical protein [Halorussus sp. MSC15.2]|uniref:hypothetical protein n=1 Tax=Halorussus sp. MSC15.2 TaxID=2283638 RepID=UPI0013D808A6|nr:hypothetical protein [Halorussus sp. MSC15.2]NEU56055.1 hypothetical protein [Halorussus sp. MSC15.2]